MTAATLDEVEDEVVDEDRVDDGDEPGSVLSIRVRRLLGPVAVEALAGGPLPRRGYTSSTSSAGLAAVHAGAACASAREVDADALTDAETQREAADVVAAYCSGCPVVAACLAAGRASRGWGVWGGTVLREGALAPLDEDGNAVPSTPRVLPSPGWSQTAPTETPHAAHWSQPADPRAVAAVVEHLRATGGTYVGGAGRLHADLLAAGHAAALPAGPHVLSRVLLGHLGLALQEAGVQVARQRGRENTTVLRLDLLEHDDDLERPLAPDDLEPAVDLDDEHAQEPAVEDGRHLEEPAVHRSTPHRGQRRQPRRTTRQVRRTRMRSTSR